MSDSKRAQVTLIDAPRPAAAWVMSIVASATLWITGELEAWVIPVQALCFGISYWTRNHPPAWRKSPGWLNVGMFCITAITIHRALQGSPATLSLAYFAALSQGLQLIDARPRKSEFVLVALALFQVILASNLTDSVFFPPLVVVFLVSVTWTLLVHTLRTEAASAGQLSTARAALTPGLMRTAVVLSGLSIVLAMGFFLMLPRMKTSVLKGGLGPSLSMSGFSDQVSLGNIGRIRKDGRVVLRVETIEGDSPAPGAGYWRGLAFDQFDGRSWSISPSWTHSNRIAVTGIPRFGVVFGSGPEEDGLVQRIVREPVEAGVLFGAGPIARIEGPMQQIQRDPNGGLYHPGGTRDRVRYTLWTRPARPADGALAGDRAVLPREIGPHAEAYAARYVALPELDPAVHDLAVEVTREASSDAERLHLLEAFLRAKGRYTDEPPDMSEVPGAASPVEQFLLGELAGHCEYFASGMIVLSRSLGIPTRLVNGFAGGRVNQIGGFTELTHADAHAWVEVHFERAGWVRYDPTPPDLRWRGAATLSLGERLAELGSVIELWWFQRVVDFDSTDQIFALRSAWHVIRDLRDRFEFRLPGAESPSSHAVSRSNTPPADWPWTHVALGFVGAGLAVLLIRRRVGHKDEPPASIEYRRALRLLARRGLIRGPTTTARSFAGAVEKQLGADAGAPFDRLTEAYLMRRFGAGDDPGTEPRGDLEAIRRALKHKRASTRNTQPNAPPRLPAR